MAATRPSSLGFSSASKVAREGGDLEVTVQTAEGPRVFTLPWFFVRDVDALLERWRREEHEAVLLTMNDGLLGRTLVDAAWAGGLRDTVFLLARGADMYFEFEYFRPLYAAASSGRLEVATVFLDAGAGVGVDLLYGGPNRLDIAVYLSACYGQTLVTALLLDRGADVHYVNDWALSAASSRGYVDTVRLLLDRGADVNAQNGQALRDAQREGHDEVVALLLERGAHAVVDED